MEETISSQYKITDTTKTKNNYSQMSHSQLGS